MDTNERIKTFLDGSPFAVVGASSDRSKYGNRVLRSYQQNDLSVYPVNPKAIAIEGLDTFASLGEIPKPVHAISIITPPVVTKKVFSEAAALGINNIWMQPGAEFDEAQDLANEHAINLISHGPCILVILGFKDI